MAKGRLKMLLLVLLTSVLLLDSVQAWTLTGSTDPRSSVSTDPDVVLFGKGKCLFFFFFSLL